METFQEFIDAGAWLGRHQTLGVIAAQCTAAQARCLKVARESQVFEKLGLSWDEFCKQYAGISRAHADDLIRRHERFGDTYFRVSELIRISPAAFAQLSDAGHIQGDNLEFDGERIPLTPENAPKIRLAIQHLRTQLAEARATPAAAVTALKIQLDGYLQVLERLADSELPDCDRAALAGLSRYAVDKFQILARTLESA